MAAFRIGQKGANQKKIIKKSKKKKKRERERERERERRTRKTKLVFSRLSSHIKGG